MLVLCMCLLQYVVLSGAAVGGSALHTVSHTAAAAPWTACLATVWESRRNGFQQPQAKGGITHKPRRRAAAAPSMEGATGANQS